MNKVLIAIVFSIFILPSTAVMADYGDDLKKREAKKLEENHKNPTPKPSGTSPAPTYDTSGMPGNSKSPGDVLKNKSGTNQQDPSQRK
mgnify:CR=1 FL=1